MDSLLVYKVRGSHRTERNIKSFLNRDPDIHSGFAGGGVFCVKITEKERDSLKSKGFKIAKKAEY